MTTLHKKSRGCFKSMVSTADNYYLKFPEGSSGKERALLFSSLLFLDYMFFEWYQIHVSFKISFLI